MNKNEDKPMKMDMNKEPSKNRCSLRRNKKKKHSKKMVLVGVNAAGISSKLDSFDDMLTVLSPTVFFIEETKVSRGGKIKTNNSQKYQIFELVRKTKAGGGIAIGVLSDVEPVQVSEGDDDVKTLVVEITAAGMEIRCICGYGPQENHSIERKRKFWSRLCTEVENAMEEDRAIILQMDGNLWAGPEVIKEDPHQCNQNGQLFKDFLCMFPQLCVVNSLDLCQGLITRRRTTIRKCEESILDFFVVCEKMLPFIERMIVDEEQQYGLSSYSKVKGKQVIKKSDHNPVILELFLNYKVKKPDRIESFNFRNKECQKQFFESTDKSSTLTEIFLKAGNVQDKAAKWMKKLNGEFHKCFRKIRHTEKKIITPITKILEERRLIIQRLKICPEEEKDKLKDILNDVEDKICSEVAKKNHAKVVDNFKLLADQTGSFQTLGMWNIKRKVFPRNKESLPFAKKDCEGKFITSQNMIKRLYLETFTHRLRHRPMKTEFCRLKVLKEELCRRRLDYVKNKKTEPWTKEQLMKTLGSLKNNKSRDPSGLVNELFKPEVIGKDLFNSLLMMMNQIKDTQSIPKVMELCNIVAIYKGKGEKADLQNDRGIFIVNIFRSIILKVRYCR